MMRGLGSSGLSLWAIAVAFGLVGQLLFLQEHVWPGRIAFILSAIFGLVAITRIDRSGGRRDPTDRTRRCKPSDSRR
jgi:hypothetical protein